MTDRFDPAQLRSVVAQLRTGAVLRGFQPVAEKIKRHVLIAATAQRSVAFLINSRPGPFIAKNPDLLKRQVPMLQRDHAFMQHDSYIACHDTVALDPMPALARCVVQQEMTILGYVSEEICSQIISASSESKIIAPRDAKLIIDSFGALAGRL